IMSAMSAHDPDGSLPFTGERFVPGTKGEIWMEHWHRYHFAARWAADRVVVDVACGEGYGAALLARGAARVTGIDVSAQAVDHARRTYADRPNLEFVRASCTALPLAEACADLAVSFETLEHIEGQEAFLAELARVLKPGGVLILSCPNKVEYSDKRDYANEFHVRELYREELASLVAARFPHCRWYGQRPTFYSVIAPEAPEGARAQLVEVDEERPAEPAPALSQPLYFLLVASREPSALDAVAPALSVLADRGDWVHRDYEKVYRGMVDASRRAEVLQQEVAQRDAQILARGLQLSECNREVARRDGWRWWLRRPLVRLGLLK
ncbi:MAG TPA: class I SAM-dependent methyltransferase, partial [Usitatibacter sp.]|nr:class I SAM-dependent methyltransferase [Usitatibacter sp.]